MEKVCRYGRVLAAAGRGGRQPRERADMERRQHHCAGGGIAAGRGVGERAGGAKSVGARSAADGRRGNRGRRTAGRGLSDGGARAYNRNYPTHRPCGRAGRPGLTRRGAHRRKTRSGNAPTGYGEGPHGNHMARRAGRRRKAARTAAQAHPARTRRAGERARGAKARAGKRLWPGAPGFYGARRGRAAHRVPQRTHLQGARRGRAREQDGRRNDGTDGRAGGAAAGSCDPDTAGRAV